MFRAQRIAGRFQLEEEAAKGGMGTVYRATDQKTHRTVAVKVLRKREIVSAGRFVREAAVLADLHNPAIVEYITHGTTSDGLHFLVMEWVEGETLGLRMERDGLNAAETVTVGIQIAQALSVAHEKGVVHRDIKPNNLMFVGGQLDQLKVLDFGIARRANEVGELTQTGVMVGTMGYMSPEQARGTRTETVEPSVDVFALGCVLFECLAGRSPFTGDNMMAVRAKILYAEPPSLRVLSPTVPPSLEAVIMRMLAKSPSARFKGGAEVAAVLRALPPMPATPRKRAGTEEAHTSDAAIAPPLRPVAVGGAAAAAIENRCVVLISAARETPDDDDDTVSDPVDPEKELERINLVAKQFGGNADSLGEGSIIVTLAGAGSPEQRAENAARMAIAIKPLVPAGTISVATEVEEKTVIDRLIDRSARTLGLGMASIDESFLDLDKEPEAAIWLDEETARLIKKKFDVRRNTAGNRLHGER